MITGLLLPIVYTLGVLTVVQTPTDHKIIFRLARPCIRPNNSEPSGILCQASLVKSTKWHIPLNKPRAASLSYLCLLLNSLSADIETNPGPIDYSCGNCALDVCDTDPAVECDEGSQWFQSLGRDTYDNWVNTDRSFSWVCSNCDSQNLSTSAQSAFSSFTSVNSYIILSEEAVASPKQRSPSPIGATSSKTFPHRDYTLKDLNVNCQSIVNKKGRVSSSYR